MRIVLIATLLVSSVAFAKPDPKAGIEAFNQAMIEATRKMDNAALGAQWETDGISLLPSTEPILGRTAIIKLITDIMASMPGAKMISFDMTCSDIEMYGDYASEWCGEHQVVSIPGKPNFDGWGKVLFVLHRGADHVWRLRREMWNQGIPKK